MRLIDADELIKKMLREGDRYTNKDICRGYHNCQHMVYDAPIIDVERHGHWEYHAKLIKDVSIEACSICGEWSYGDNKAYCPCCGAKMDEVEEDGID